MPSEMAIRVRRVTRITSSEIEALVRLLPQLSPRLAGVTERQAAERAAALVTSGNTAFYVAETAAGIVGMLSLAWYDVPSGRKAWIEDVVVDAAARGLGAGRALVHAAQDQARAIGAERVSLTSNASRTAARALYRQCGFNEAETTLFACKTDTE